MAVAQVKSTVAPLSNLKEDTTLYAAAAAKLLEERKIHAVIRAIRKIDLCITNTCELSERRAQEAITTINNIKIEEQNSEKTTFSFSTSTPKKDLNVSKVKYFDILSIVC